MDFIRNLVDGEQKEIPKKQWNVNQENFSLDGPLAVNPKDEDKWICRCGQSKNYPYCDGSHKAYNEQHGTKETPLKVNQGNDTVYVCRCGYSKDKPFCDGAHSILKKVELERENGVFNLVRYALPIIPFVFLSIYIKNHLQ
ncbi:hypothetical protein DICPUDRAFT_87658 [Dictyostelium purpureum]|uniref:Iron-binding zinc finger CDGSH type domain-containing protein n=1 Tax=Dictyostelium purpureum TaxID=5786 RepID=F0ZJK1_DICPU|nr:uncharacterized protein DICPUDRAFT_87658 [Dictyostelium purpureum]EGC35875.1 hypothetical protein DICPUDRAFT_87658 [Dictyostelium purpureum]|eukprot:XP_003287606.1 hypothetical protein DICPUDRAFT_87658 [Dictyostelium purpureum]